MPSSALTLDPKPRFPAMVWREPGWLWLLVAYGLSAGWPFVALGGGGGLAVALAFGVAVTAGLALVTALGLFEGGRPLRARRDVVGLFLIYGTVASLIAPTVVGLASGATGTSGYDGAMAASLWPLGLMVGLPVALFAGLAFAVVMFVKPPAREPDLEVTAEPRAIERHDDDDF